MFSVTGLQFAYTQAPESMKSVIQGFWLFTVSIGDIIVSIVVGMNLLKVFNQYFFMRARSLMITIQKLIPKPSFHLS